MAEENKGKTQAADEKEGKTLKKAAVKTVKPAKTKVPLGKRVKNFFRDYKSEIRKIVWPTRAQVIKNTSIVVTVILFVGVIIGLLDFGFSRGILALGRLGY